MKYQPLNNELYTDDYLLIKRFRCPLNKRWGELLETSEPKSRFCGSCNKNVLNISDITEETAIKLFNAKPDLCAYINFKESDIEILADDKLEELNCSKLSQVDHMTTIYGLEKIAEAFECGDRVYTYIIKDGGNRARFMGAYSKSDKVNLWLYAHKSLSNTHEKVAAFTVPTHITEQPTEVYIKEPIEPLYNFKTDQFEFIKPLKATITPRDISIHNPTFKYMVIG